MTLPHHFPSLLGEPDSRPPVVLIGAGMSFGEVPHPIRLMADQRDSAETFLGWKGSMPYKTAYDSLDLYSWADEAIQHLEAESEPIPKLKLAESLGILRDSRWLGLPYSRKNRARQRVLARFAREGRIKTLWSLNWDCLLEQALQNCGMKRNGIDDGLPWMTAFQPLITFSDFSPTVTARGVKLVKPHGCAEALIRAEELVEQGNTAMAKELAERFFITKSELEKINATDPPSQMVFTKLCDEVKDSPYYGAGWSASEPYIVATFKDVIGPAKCICDKAADELTVVDITFNDKGHLDIATAYGLTEVQAYAQVNTTSFTTDDLFLLLQAQYGIDQLLKWAHPDDGPILEQARTDLWADPDTKRSLIQWFDNFLPAWVRLCWRCGLCQCQRLDGQLMKPHEISIDLPDEHIPWQLEAVVRSDLRSAARILVKLLDGDRINKYDFERFKGGIYLDNNLVVPIPYSATLANFDLRGLKPLGDDISAGGSMISQLQIRHIDVDDPNATTPIDAHPAYFAVSKELNLVRLVAPSTSKHIEWEDL